LKKIKYILYAVSAFEIIILGNILKARMENYAAAAIILALIALNFIFYKIASANKGGKNGK